MNIRNSPIGIKKDMGQNSNSYFVFMVFDVFFLKFFSIYICFCNKHTLLKIKFHNLNF